MGKRYFILQVPLVIDFPVTVWPISQGWGSNNADPIQGTVGTVQAHCGRVVWKIVVAKKTSVNLMSRPYELID